MYQRLKTLYQLQEIDDQLDELEELRGDLPNAVNNLKTKINDLKDEMAAKEKEKKESQAKRIENEEQIETILESQKKFKAQLYQVRNNKEYDALTKEIDHSDDNVKKLQKENENIENLVSTLNTDIEDLKPLIQDLNKELTIKETDLKEIIKSNEVEEEKLRKQRNSIEPLLKGPDLSVYKRIRKAKKGKAVASIKRSACSGCNNIVPSQRQLEIRRNNKVFFCEYCGRILVSPEIADDNS